jgi:hypothetical protein
MCGLNSTAEELEEDFATSLKHPKRQNFRECVCEQPSIELSLDRQPGVVPTFWRLYLPATK